jgi:hypothetical protein
MRESEIQELYAAVRDYMIPFITTEWLSFAPSFLAPDAAAMAKALPPGVSLGEAYPDIWPGRSVVEAPGLTPSSSQSAAPSPLVVSPRSHMPSSSSGISSQLPIPLGTELAAPSSGTTDPGLSAEPAGSVLSSEPPPKHGRTLARAAYRQPKRTHPFVGDPPPSSQASMASKATAPAPTRTPKKRTKLDMGPRIGGTRSCVGCVTRKSKCAPPLGSEEPFPCAWCVHVGEGNTCPDGPEGSECFLLPDWLIDLLSFRPFQARYFNPVLASPGFDQASHVAGSRPGRRTFQPWHSAFPSGRRAIRRASGRSHSWDPFCAAGGSLELVLRDPGRLALLCCE